MKNETLFQIENFDGFAILRSHAEEFGANELAPYLQAMKRLCDDGIPLIFLDFGKAQSMKPEILSNLTQEISNLKAKKAIDIGLLYEPALGGVFLSSSLPQHAMFFERQENEGRRVIAQKVLHDNRANIQVRLKSTLENAIGVALKRWSGKAPKAVAPGLVNLDPGTDVISVVEMNIDGCLFRVFLSVSQETLRAMIEKMLHMKVEVNDPIVRDGACELLNYMTAYFKQQLTSEDSVVDAEAPWLIDVDEMMVTLTENQPAQRVETEEGALKVWMDEAA